MSSSTVGPGAPPPGLAPTPNLANLPSGTYLPAVASDLLPWFQPSTTTTGRPASIIPSLPVPVRTVGTLHSCDPSTQTATLNLALHDLTPLPAQRQRAGQSPPVVQLRFDLVPAMAGFPVGSTVDLGGELKNLARGEDGDRDGTVGIQVRLARVVDGMDVRLWAATALAVRKAWVL